MIGLEYKVPKFQESFHGQHFSINNMGGFFEICSSVVSELLSIRSSEKYFNNCSTKLRKSFRMHIRRYSYRCAHNNELLLLNELKIGVIESVLMKEK